MLKNHFKRLKRNKRLNFINFLNYLINVIKTLIKVTFKNVSNIYLTPFFIILKIPFLYVYLTFLFSLV